MSLACCRLPGLDLNRGLSVPRKLRGPGGGLKPASAKVAGRRDGLSCWRAGNEFGSCSWGLPWPLFAPASSSDSLLSSFEGSWEKMQVSPARQFPVTQYLVAKC